jgi:hypothetical protein
LLSPYSSRNVPPLRGATDSAALETPSEAAEPFLVIGYVGDPKLLFQKSVVAQPPAAQTDEMRSIRPEGMLPVCKRWARRASPRRASRARAA